MARFPNSEASLVDVQQLQQQLQQQTDLRETIQRIRQGLTVNDVYTTVVQALMDFFQADWIFLLENGPCHWRSVGSSLCVQPLNGSNVFNAYLSLESVITKLEQPFPIAVDAQSVQEVPVDQQWLSQFPGAWLLSPIHLPHAHQMQLVDRLWGVVAIGRKDMTNSWTGEPLEQAKILADEIAIALHHGLLYEQVKQDNHALKALALTDSLTRLANRRQFDHYFEAEWNRLAREQQPLTLILCDIDYFKRYNDYYGHPMGDVCLSRVSDVLTHCIRRPADLVARYGGEEFAVVLPNTNTAGGHNVALAIQHQLEKASIPHATSDVTDRVTLTMGIATVIPEHHLVSQDLLQAADLALYHAKQQGRDRIYVHAHYYVHDDTRIQNVSLDPTNHFVSQPEDGAQV
ncbi:diguanylate cyclase with pas pac and gaf sensor [Leptolyngbya sp. Heron Island J]|uniref:diguanylate cyclase domain-containing protein n=1 Tax=Leptolyngbya sp. Heron Island J TaxID=1385935 RepID=UPI0003B9FA7F|nr:diguanylate cyclase [Leptolyngbya sp. Heron Island J]ESA37621.1 diguanylate cyclase with pas pac and gaf sensor [Leptolyngbya sp. Heron Island J]